MLHAAAAQNVLLIDDNETDNFVHKRIIELTGFAEEVVVKDSVKRAFEYLETFHQKMDKFPDLIFLDINMPAADGFVFLTKFEETFPMEEHKCKIVVLSSSESTRDISRMIANKFVKEYIHKPLTEESLERLKNSLALK